MKKTGFFVAIAASVVPFFKTCYPVAVLNKIAVISSFIILGLIVHVVHAETTIPLSTIQMGQDFGLDGSPQELVITDQSDWEIFWENLYSHYSHQQPVPAIDFDQEMIIAITMGTMPDGCSCLRITDVEETHDFVRVQYLKNMRSQDDVCTEALTNPYHIISIPKTDKEILFSSTVVTGVNCYTFISPCDLDEDGFLSDNGSCGGNDCNDQNPAVYPGAIEICGDKIDSNCDGLDSAKPTLPAIPSPGRGTPAIPAEPPVPCISGDRRSIHLETSDGIPWDLSLDTRGQGLGIRITDAVILEADKIGLELPLGLIFEAGFLAFEVELPQGVDRVTVRISIPPSVQFPKVVKVVEGRIIQEGDPELDKVQHDMESGYASFVLIDNGPLDNDATPGVIFDPVAVAESERTEIISENSPGGKGAGGGCTLDQGAPNTDLFTLLLPVLLLGLRKIRYKIFICTRSM